MAIPKKGSRRICIDSTTYVWMVRRRPTYCQEMGWSPLSFAVELEAGGCQTLQVSVDVSRPDSVFNDGTGVITPAVVERAIRQALQQGWQPTINGSPKLLEVSLSSPEPNRSPTQ